MYFSVGRKKGLKIGETYTNDYQAKEFIHYIAEDERRKMRARLSDGKFISVMSDGSLDSAVMEEEMVYVRSASEGKAKVDFVGVKAVSKPDATNIAEAVCSIMESGVSTDWKNKLVAITTDGASVMTGVNNGVVAKLRADRPSVLGIHCMAHKLELAFSDGIRKNVMARKVEDLLSGLYTLYHKSGVNRASLKQHFRELHMKALMPTRVGGTRWLPHLFKALDHFLRGYAGIVRHLEKSQEATNVNAVLRAKTKGFLNIGKDGGVLRFCCLLHDTIYQLSNLSKSLQRSVSTVAEAQSCLSSTQAVIEKYKSRPGPKLRAVLDTDTYEGVLLRPTDADRHDKAKNELMGSLCRGITARFSDVNSGVLQALRRTRFQYWPEADTSSDFGDEEVNKLISHFRPLFLSAGVDVELVPDQWTVLQTDLHTAGSSQGNFEQTWPTVNRMLRYRCPDVLDLFDALLTIPATTADCERGFSVMKQVKSDWRSRLKGETLSDLLKTQLCSPDIKDFDPTKAIEIWHADSLRSRRPDFVRKHGPKETEGGSDSDGTTSEEEEL
ncbi:zinc finger protein 862 [Etheostoma spectabile]|uniref:zinc finger protein 862 n=1 Tax=Etheostoma spectabile TaxID=54343 RepID=UPI0013AFA026|nr:zinc finger protein 862-like [Etheostoma spectabile]